MALTLVEAAKLNPGTEYQRAVIETFAASTDLLTALPFRDINGNALSFNQEGTLPSTAFRGVNEAYTAAEGVLDPKTETLAIAGGDVDVDRFIVQTQGAAARAAHEAMKVKALGHAISQKIVKGDSTSLTKEFDGLQTRAVSAQVVSNSSATNGAGLSLAKLDEAIDAVDAPTHLLMTKATRRRITIAARTTTVGGYVTYTTDAFGRKLMAYNDLPILIADGNGDNNAALGADEAYTGGGTSDGTSVYVLRLADDGVIGLQNGMISVRDLGEQDSSPVFRTRVEWYVGLAVMHPRAFCRLRDVDSAVAATA